MSLVRLLGSIRVMGRLTGPILSILQSSAAPSVPRGVTPVGWVER